MTDHNPTREQLVEIEKLFTANRLPEALTEIDALIKIFEKSDLLHLTRGICLIRMKHFDAAKSCLSMAATLNPKKPEIFFQIGVCHMQSKNVKEAIAHFQHAISLGLDSFAVHFRAAICFEKLGGYHDALRSIKKAIMIDSSNSDAFNQLGAIYLSLREWESAKPCFEKALELSESGVSLSNLAVTQMMLGEPEKAIDAIKRAIQIDPTDANAHNTLGTIYMETGAILKALEEFRLAVKYRPDFAEALSHIGGALLRLRRTKEAVQAYEKALSVNPHDPEFHNNRNLALNYDSSFSAAVIFQKHREFGEIFDRPSDRFQRPPRPKEKLRIGYISADFRKHSVNYFLEPVLRNHDSDSFEIFCYHNSNIEDAVTLTLKQFADQWRTIKNLTDEQAAQLVNDDQVDILVDLSGHTNGSRLPVFGFKPAPIQCTWLGYPNTTGLKTIDYRLTDELTDPSAGSDRYYTETRFRIDGGFSCYQGDVSVGPANRIRQPKSTSGITFGCFNNLIKVTDEVIEVWSTILHNVPSARLILKTGLSRANDLVEPIVEQFSRAGVDPERINIKSRIEDWAEHVKLYDEIDIGLDPFPYNGTTTTCEALWMGVPVIVLAGNNHVSRVGHSLVTQVGYPELSADTTQGYVTIATELANDENRLSSIKNNLRPRMQASSLGDHGGFTDKLETAYKTMWKKLCAESSFNT